MRPEGSPLGGCPLVLKIALRLRTLMLPLALAPLTLIGHSHLCKVFALTKNSVEELPPIDFELQPDRKYIVSVGSVGQPRDYDNRASYTLYDSTKKRFEFKRVEYDIETAADKVLRAKLERNFAHRLFIGV